MGTWRSESHPLRGSDLFKKWVRINLVLFMIDIADIDGEIFMSLSGWTPSGDFSHSLF